MAKLDESVNEILELYDNKDISRNELIGKLYGIVNEAMINNDYIEAYKNIVAKMINN